MKMFFPVILVGLAVAVMLVVWLLWPQKEPKAVVAPPKVVQQGPRLVIEGAGESTGAGTISSEMRSILPEHITLSMIREIRQENGRKVLVFSDASELELTPYLTSQLPPEVRLRVEYKRGK